MYSLTIHFGPNAMVWSFLYKDEKKAQSLFNNVQNAIGSGKELGGIITDDFGQTSYIDAKSISGVLLEDMDLVEEARIYRSLANARGEVKARKRAATDPVIREGMNAGPSVLQPRFNG
jgi:hypothetical protein